MVSCVFCCGGGVDRLRNEAGPARQYVGHSPVRITRYVFWVSLSQNSRNNSKTVAEEEVPKFSMTSRKVKAGDLGEEGEDG